MSIQQGKVKIEARIKMNHNMKYAYKIIGFNSFRSQLKLRKTKIRACSLPSNKKI